jgi:hypothetical protein
MKTSLIALILTAVAAASDVADLKKDTFDSFIKENDLVLAECMPLFCYFIELLLIHSSLCTMVRSLQGPCPRVRGGRHYPEGEKHCLGQD